ncbi:hypothetical protein shim_09800 [Shimia sp. SK013]|uniref:hypothetical protein n=1 Tax=Shimia sp. SK013 TaxID=1389006 RepID=UPI0006B43FA9|nr:hypothetical protein [Shimia sp. SK013]KPA22693.1 hypothetical protein shim_09800 [Shimia sp. SK013]
MKIDWRSTTHEGWIDALDASNNDIFGVLKFYNGRTIGKSKAMALLGAYWHRVDRTLFGKAADKGYGIERWCFTEYGSDRRNLHIHFVATSPIAIRPCCAVLNALWADMHRSTADVTHNWITPIQDRRAAFAYTTKGTRYLRADFIGEKISHTNAASTNLGTDYTEAQIRRIANRITDRQLTKAYEAMERQIVQTALKRQTR